MLKVELEQTQQTRNTQKASAVQNTKNQKTVTVPVGVASANNTTSPLIMPEFTESIEANVLRIKEALLFHNDNPTLDNDSKLYNYNLTLNKDNISMLRKSQTNLIDLIKYYDGDPDYYYEGYTAVYSDTFGKKTSGFGHYYPKKIIKTQEDAYKTLADDLIEANKNLSNIIGKEKYKSLPLSIREALIDLAFNKGPDKLKEKPELMKAINDNDYSKIVANLYYYTSGSNNADKNKEEAGLYRRSFSRSILATRDLTGKELKEAKTEIDNLYITAKAFFTKKGTSAEDLDNIYKCFKNEPITSKPKASNNFKIKVKKGSGLLATANEAYLAQNDTTVSIAKYREEFYKINKNPQNLKEGEELIAPNIKNIKAALTKETTTTVEQSTADIEKVDGNITERADSTQKTIKQDSIPKNENIHPEDISAENESSSNGVLYDLVNSGIEFCAEITAKATKRGNLAIAAVSAGIGYNLHKFANWLYGETDKIVETESNIKYVDVSKKYKKEFERDDILPEVKEILKEKRLVDGEVAANRKELNAKILNVKVKSDKLKGKTIIVNAGHGYTDSDMIDRGAPAIGDINEEWLLNANNSIRLAKELCANGAKVIYLQGREKVIPLISNELEKPENKADLFISVHVNSFDGKTQDRTQFYFDNPTDKLEPKNDINAKSKALAQLAEERFDEWIPEHEEIDTKDAFYLDKAKTEQDYAQLKARPLQVCKTAENKQNIPAVLWEVAYMVSPKGRERLTNDTLMDNYMKIFTDVIIEYLNN